MIALAAALLTGLAGSLHCAGMCGPLMLLVGRIVAAERSWLYLALYHGGRLLTYALLGALAGSIFMWTSLAGQQQWLSMLFGALLIVFAVIGWKAGQVTVFPELSRLLHGAAERAFRYRGWPRMMLLGMMNGLLPCGLVYVALAVAAASGSVLQGALIMLSFGSGTLPVLMFMSVAAGRLPLQRWWRPVTLRILTLIAGLLLIVRGLNLDIPFLSPAAHEGGLRCEHCSSR